MSEQEDVSLDLEQLKGLGKVGVEKLNIEGIHDIKNLSTASSVTVSEALGKSREWANDLIRTARNFLIEHGIPIYDYKIISGGEHLKREQSKKKIKTGVDDLDNLLGGGIETRAITEFYGKFGSGKSQICFTLSALVTLPESEGGLDGDTLYLDAEGTFSSARISEILKARKMDESKIDRVHIFRPVTSDILEAEINRLPVTIKELNIKLVVVDSIIILHRQEYMGRGLLAPRQQSLSAIMNKLLKLAEDYNIAVVITNQISSDPGANPLYGEEVDHATGGNVIAHASSHRIRLERSGKKIKARMIDSPRLSNQECAFILNEKGIDKFIARPGAS